MVALLPSVGFWIIAGLAVFHQFVKPKLPKYSFQINQIPTLKWVGGLDVRTKLGAGVKLRNDNYVKIDVHALSFDLYYPDWRGSLNHIGHIHDKEQLNGSADEAPRRTKARKKSPPLWSLAPRAEFSTQDHVFVQPAGGIKVLSSLGWDLLAQSGELIIPSSGVIHIRANSQVKVTLSILCDNVLDALTLEMQGMECEMDSLKIGWLDMASSVSNLRNFVMDTHRYSGGSVISKPAPPSFHDEFERAANKVSWTDALSLLNF